MKRSVVALSILLLAAGSSFGNPIQNAGFETGPDPGVSLRLNPGDTSISPWAIVSGNVDYLGPTLFPCSGSRSVDLNGNAPGAISQTFATKPQATYRVTFCLAGNPRGTGDPVKTLNVLATGNAQKTFQFDTTGRSDANMGWVQQTYDFTATGASTTLTFQSATSGPGASSFGPAVDDVRVGELYPIAQYYDGFTDFAAPACSSANGGSITTGLQTASWVTPPAGATETRLDAVNGTATSNPSSYPAPAGSGTIVYASYSASGLGAYPFTYTVQYTTSVGGVVASVSTAAITCIADGPGVTSFVLGAPPPTLENPQPASYQSGIGLLSGWSCQGPYIGVSIDGHAPLGAPYGSARADTAGVCGAGNTNTGYGLLLNFNTLGAGAHSAQLYVDGQAIGSPTTFTVTVPLGEFIIGASQQVMVPDFPTLGRTTTLIWQQSQQNFAVKSVAP